jgi:hypothetical protein
VRRAGTISISGVSGGTATPLNLLQLFDKGVSITQGQAHVKRRIDDIMPLLTGDSDPLDVEGLATTSFRSTRRRTLRDLPEETGRGDQGRPAALTTVKAGTSATASTG